MELKDITPLPANIDFQALQEISISSSSMVQLVRDHVFAPERTKRSPTFGTAELLEISEATLGRYKYLYDKEPSLPRGNIPGSRREFTLSEFRRWQRALRPEAMRNPETAAACTIAVSNFKGGSTKTTTAATLAQGLSLRGHSVLLVDLDPQGSASSLFGYLPDVDVSPDMTVAPLCEGVVTSVDSAIRPTYWAGVDIVAASPALHNAEFFLPSRHLRERGFEFWRCLDVGLDNARLKYDVIVIDSPPSLSYITINSLIAADGILMPLVPSALDFASSAQFWNLCVELIEGLYEGRGRPDKKYAFVDVLLSKVDPSVGVASAVRDWIISAYGSKVLPVEIPKTSVADTASATFGTVYDLMPGSVAAKTLRRAKTAYEAMVSHVESQVRGVWKAQHELATKENSNV